MGSQGAKITYFDGSQYFGETKNDKENGEGKIVSPRGFTLEGKFEDGECTSGKITYKDKSCYEGEMKNNMYHGEGVY
jgi:hypothetical protein